MARLSDRYLMQQVGSTVILFEEGHTEREIVRFDPGDITAVQQAQRDIAASLDLAPEEKSCAYFWSGYFYAHAGAGG